MIEIEDMTNTEMMTLLQRVGYGHLGCSRDGSPYVLPIHYAYAEPYLYIYTTEGMKTDFIAKNPEVCLQIEDIKDPAHWQSVIITSKVERVSKSDRDLALEIISERNPALSSALSKVWIDAWGRDNVEAIFRM